MESRMRSHFNHNSLNSDFCFNKTMSKAEHLLDFCLKSILVQRLIFGTSALEKIDLWANLCI